MEEMEELLRIIGAIKEADEHLQILIGKRDKIDNMLKKLRQIRYNRLLIRLETKLGNTDSDNNIFIDIIFKDAKEQDALKLMFDMLKDITEQDMHKTKQQINQLLNNDLSTK
jgi:hypothetical protein